MNILIISQFFPPDITAAAFRVGETVELLREHGHAVRVITAYPHRSDVRADKHADQKNGVRRVPVAGVNGGGAARYIMHYFSFMLGSLWIGGKQRFGSWRPDVIWATSPPLFVSISGYGLSRLFGCPLVFEVRDVWPACAVVTGQISATGWGFKLGRKLEKWIYARSDHITCVSQPMARYIRSESKVLASVIYNGALEKYTPVSVAPKIKKRLVYAGNLGRAQGLDVCIRAFAKAVNGGAFEGWTFEFIGGGALEQELRQLARKCGIGERVLFHPPMNKADAVQAMASSGLLLINLKADPVLELTIPSKVFDYMLVGRPILYGLVGEGQAILEETGGNIGFRPGDEQSMLGAMVTAFERLTQLEAKAAANPACVRGKYSREHNAEKLIEVFKQVLDAK